MRRIARSLVAFTLVVSIPAFVTSAFAHGGRYQPPAGEVPEGSREPTDPPPPPEGGQPKTPSGEPEGGPVTPKGPDTGNPTTPKDGPAGPGTPSGGPPPSGPSGGPSGSPTTRGGGGASKKPGFGGWLFWWAANKDEILQVKSSVRVMHAGVRTGTGFGNRGGSGLRSVTDEAIQDRIVPALRKLLADDAQSFHIRSAAELGLAKIGDTSIVPALRAMAGDEEKKYHREIEETAALALGLLQQDDAGTRAFLADILRRTSLDGSYVRPFAAVSLGLLGGKNDPERLSMESLFEVTARRETSNDVKPSCLLGLGLLGDDAAIPELVAMLRAGRSTRAGAVPLSDVETAYAAAALGKIGRPGTSRAGEETIALDEIVRLADKDRSKADLNTRRSAVIALGQIAPQCAPKAQRVVVDLLQGLADEASDSQERSFAIMSLGRIGAARSVDPAARREIEVHLVRAMQRGRDVTPPFAAIALGLIGSAVSAEKGPAPEEEIRKPLRQKFEDEKDPGSKAAFALACGLARDPLAADSLQKSLKDRRTDRRVRGFAALALGLIGDRTAAETIRTVLKDDTDRDLRVLASMAAGLLRDPASIADLTAVLREPDASNYELGSAALALGQIGDEQAIDALLEIAVDTKERYTVLTRALAVVALGQIGDRRDVPVLARVGTDINYRAFVPAVTELLTIL